MKQDITGAVIAGGASRRFGSPKAFAKKDGKAFYQISIAVLRPFVNKIFLVTSPALAACFRHDDTDVKIIEDIPHYQGDGPLAGIYSAMTSCETEWLLTLPVDVPFMKSEVLEVLLREMGDEVDAVIPIVDEKMQVLVGLFRCTIKDKIKTQLDQEERKVDHLLEKIATRYVKIDDTRAFFNINRQSEYHKYVANIEH